MRAVTLSLLSLLSLAACEPAGSDPFGDTGDLGSGPSSAQRPGDAAEPLREWVPVHPCGPDGVSTMGWDGFLTAWLGCRSTPGLWLSRDGGGTWEEPVTEPPHHFRGAIVSQISRASDDLLYVVSEREVSSLDRDGRTAPVLIGSDGFAPATFARGDSGLSAVASTDGVDVAYRFNDRAAFAPSDDWAPSSERLHDLVAWGDHFYGVGSALFLDPDSGQRGSLGFRLDTEGLGDAGEDVELFDLDVDDGGLVAVGVDHARASGLVLSSGPDPDDLDAWQTFDVGVAFPQEASHLEGACRDQDVVVAVGHRGEDERGLVLRSDDGGHTWSDLTPERVELPRVQRCWVFADGSMTVAGADGLFVHWDPNAP